MTVSIAEIAGMFFTTTGALLIFLYLVETPKFAREWLSPEGQQAFARHRRLLLVGVGLLVAWIVLQYISLILS
jgi:multisubunit Na+/H+ antiporter MnhB subunit